MDKNNNEIVDKPIKSFESNNSPNNIDTTDHVAIKVLDKLRLQKSNQQIINLI
jgi:hypothetical protein